MSNLYIVGTPIGNLEDITVRALKTLEKIKFIFSEDTRVSKKLLSKFDIHAKVFSIYTPNKKLNLKKFKEIILDNDIAFVTDAGSPGVSDPAGEFVKIARSENHVIIPIPGVSAVTSAFSVSGYESNGFSFLGFLPKSNIQKTNYISKYFATSNPIVIFESPHRVVRTLKDIHNYWGNRIISICRELTKIYEETFLGNVMDAELYFSKSKLKGEFVLMVAKKGYTLD